MAFEISSSSNYFDYVFHKTEKSLILMKSGTVSVLRIMFWKVNIKRDEKLILFKIRDAGKLFSTNVRRASLVGCSGLEEFKNYVIFNIS